VLLRLRQRPACCLVARVRHLPPRTTAPGLQLQCRRRSHAQV
jgi:hypothetical protein